MSFRIASFAAPAGPASAPSPAIDLEYRPGVCNIGPAEIARRRRTGHVGALLTVGLLVALILVDAPPLARLALVVPAAIAASGYLQAALRFCAGFGALGVRNFGAVGTTEKIVDPVDRARDRRRAIEIGLASGLVGAVVVALALALPI